MDEQVNTNKIPDNARLEAMRKLPREVLETLDKEEVQAFLHEKDWPDSLKEKLRDYLVEEGG